MNLVLALLVGGTIFVADSPDVLTPDTAYEPVLQGVERTITGTISDYRPLQQHARRVIDYETCPECVSLQPFPEGDLPDD